MASLNKAFLIGNLTRDPELRYTPSGLAVTSFTVASNRVYVTASGEKKEIVSFVRVVVWGKRAETCGEYLSKGSSVFVEGRIQSRSWQAQDGSKRNTIEVIASNVQFLGAPKTGSAARDSKYAKDKPHEEAAPAGDISINTAELQEDVNQQEGEVPF
ncbi:MAG: single-stranded DNA-binding protein [Candidatus Omnitrophica bacterium]|nr:single-stranded DNA-binding protein [Candidatus Omnitrophota bacterium]